MNTRAIGKRLLPPALTDFGQRLGMLGAREWEYVPEGWALRGTGVRGWNVEKVVAEETAKWPGFVGLVNGTGPLGIAHEARAASQLDYSAHNTIAVFGYVLARAAHAKHSIAILDWGGGLGHYYVFSSALLPEVELAYTCRDLPLMCAAGRRLLPGVTFCEDDACCLTRSYDLVHAGTSLQYFEDWRETASALAGATSSYLYVARLPVVEESDSFVVLQRPYRYGYETEYLCWYLHRREFLAHLTSCGLELVREFLMMDRPFVYHAPEQGEYRGFLFRRRDH